MNTLDTQVNMRHWKADTWRLGFANLLITMSLYMLLPILPNVYLEDATHEAWMIGASVAFFGIGLFLLGPLFAYVVDAYSRKRVCQNSILLVILATVGFYFFDGLTIFFCLRLVQGTAFGLVQMTLGSTLLLDLTETKRRTESGNLYAWFGRFAISLGPLVGLLVYKIFGEYNTVILTSAGLCVIALFLTTLLRIPFRAPLKPKIISLDRFWLPRGVKLFTNLFPLAACAGILLAVNQLFEFYAFVMVGFFLALISRRVVFATADLRAEVVCGLLFVAAAMLLHITHNPNLVIYGASVMIGFGVGLVAPKFQLYYIKISEHCERGTAQTSYMLCWESGICLGFFIGYSLLGLDVKAPYVIGLVLCAIALLQYVLSTHRFLEKNRLR